MNIFANYAYERVTGGRTAEGSEQPSRIGADTASEHNRHGRRFQPGAGLEESFRDADFAPEMVVVPAGEAWMGSKAGEGEDNERPLHKVSFISPFAAGKYPVTVAEYLAAVNAGGCAPPEWREEGSPYHIVTGERDHYKKLGDLLTGARHPAVGISWHDARSYAAWLAVKTGKPYGLLSEAEWEYACRAGGEGAYCFGSSEQDLEPYAWYGWNSGGRLHSVGAKLPNAWGLHDMHGGVLEWCKDCWNDDYSGAPGDGSAWVAEGDDDGRRVLRGGHWSNCPLFVRSAVRVRDASFMRSNNTGFRVARALPV